MQIISFDLPLIYILIKNDYSWKYKSECEFYFNLFIEDIVYEVLGL